MEKGGWKEQRLITATLGSIAEKAKASRIESPAILVVGDVVRLSEKLGKKRIAILRPAHQQAESAALAEEYGFSPVAAPTIALEERPLPADLLKRIEDVECVAFTSANGVKIALKIPGLQTKLAGRSIVAIGPKTRQALAEKGLDALVPEEYSSAGLERMLRGRCSSILFLRSAQGSRYLSQGLAEAGLFVDDIPLYDTIASGDPRLDEMIMIIRSVDIFAFTSSSTARFLVQRAEELSRREELFQALAAGTVAAIGLPTAQELKQLGIRVDVMPERFTFQAMLALLKERLVQ